MLKPDFAEAVELILAEDKRFDRDAYFFLRDALDYTTKLRKKQRDTLGNEHVTGQQLLEGVRQYALKQFGPMVLTVFEYWGIKHGFNFGEMVYSLIRLETFGKTEADSIEDFRGGYTFAEAFVEPFQPQPGPVSSVVGTARQTDAATESV